MLFLGVLASRVCAQKHPGSFQQQQLAHARVQVAAKERDARWRHVFAEKNVQFPPRRLFLLAFKREATLELWASDDDTQKYVLLKSFHICSSSGQAGPKRRVGDGQVPEGFYEIDRFNPQSNFYLSLRVSYPNASDRILGTHGNWGGDIFVHGNCVTIGCMPITDDGSKRFTGWRCWRARTDKRRFRSGSFRVASPMADFGLLLSSIGKILTWWHSGKI